MKAEEREFSFIQGEMILEVPFFQRGYVWSEENWGELLDNLFDRSQSHFIGSIILKQQPDGVPGEVERIMIIDGQQRLTTLSVLLRACYDTLSLGSGSGDWADNQRTFLMKSLMYQEPGASDEWVTKVVHSRLDADDYNAVIRGKWTHCYEQPADSGGEEGKKRETGKILRCYSYFMSDLETRPADEVLMLWNMLVGSEIKLIVKIDLGSEENEQAIFDTVNTAGVRLRSSDTIKNALFQRALECAGDEPRQRQEIIDFYSATWENTFLSDDECLEFWQSERAVGRLIRDNLEVLLRSVAIIRGFFDPTDQKISSLPVLFKGYVKESGIEDVMALVNEICRFSVTYREHFVGLAQYSFWKGKSRLNRVFSRCDFSPFDPFILKTLNNCVLEKDSTIPRPILDQFGQLESYVTRHFVCGVSAQDFNKECLSLLCGEKTIADLRRDKDNELNDRAVEAACTLYRTFNSKQSD